MILIRIFLEKMQDNAETSDDIKDRAEFVFRMGDGSRLRCFLTPSSLWAISIAFVSNIL
jgi:hypothetical protein